MTLDSIDIDKTIADVKRYLKEEQGLSPGFVASMELLLVLMSILINKLGLNSRNSSKPPSSDPNRPKEKKPAGQRKPGGQKGHDGKTLEKVADPDYIEKIEIDRSKLPAGQYKEVGYESRQVVDIDITRIVTEYRAQILEDEHQNRYVAEFPKEVTRPVQYGTSVKASAVYLSQYQLIPYARLEEMFADQFQIPLSCGSVYNFNEDAYERLELFESLVKEKLIYSPLMHVDETGINIDGKRLWLHSASTDRWTLFFPHGKRGSAAMDDMGIIPNFAGILCHDHWKPYFKYDCEHALCNAHHLRELERAFEQDKQQWAKEMQTLLNDMNKAVNDAGGQLDAATTANYKKQYRAILYKAQIECPPPDENRRQGSRGRIKRSKSRNLLERLTDFEKETLRFLDDPLVPFTNNQGENDIRMTKVQQKISGCFRSQKGADIFCRVRSYISTCRKNGLRASEALRQLFSGRLPDFLSSDN
jgi:transposase